MSGLELRHVTVDEAEAIHAQLVGVATFAGLQLPALDRAVANALTEILKVMEAERAAEGRRMAEKIEQRSKFRIVGGDDEQQYEGGITPTQNN